MVIVLGEISHHNTAKFFSPNELTNDSILKIHSQPSQWDQMDGCNAFSLSLATAIPRETVRRKVAELKKRGWIEDIAGRGLRITKACVDHFGPDFSMTILAELLKAARAIEHVLGTSAGSASAEPAEGRQVSSTASAAKRQKKAGLRSARKPTDHPKPNKP